MITARFRLWASCWILRKAEPVTPGNGNTGKKIRNLFHVDANNVVKVSIYFVTSIMAIMHDVLRRGTSLYGGKYYDY